MKEKCSVAVKQYDAKAARRRRRIAGEILFIEAKSETRGGNMNKFETFRKEFPRFFYHSYETEETRESLDGYISF